MTQRIGRMGTLVVVGGLGALTAWAVPASAQRPVRASAAARTSDAVPDWAALGVDVHTAVRHYAVEGRTAAEVGRRLRDAGPVAPDGTRAAGLTTYRLWLRWSARPDGDACRVGDVRAQVDVLIQLPEWRRTNRVSEEDLAAWATLADELADHEGKHRDAALYAAYRLVRSVEGERGRDCVVLGRRVRAEISRAREVLERTQARIDGGGR